MESESGWSVFVAYDDLPARKRATAVCDFITARFWPEIEFDLHWCGLDRLGSPECARKAVDCASNARIVIIATSARDDIPAPVASWLNEWCVQRHGREGALIGLIDESAESQRREAVDHFLRAIAHRAGLDYLTHAPESGLALIPDESDWIIAKAEGMSSVLDGILSKTISPPKLDNLRTEEA